MKRSWIGVAMLVVILCSALAVTWAMDKIHDPVAQDLKYAANAALAEDWDAAQALAAGAGERWQKWAHFRGCFADHGPMEEIDGNFAQLAAYGTAEEAADFAAACGETARKVEAMGQAHSISWWNVF